jgi:hypothetical protein
MNGNTKPRNSAKKFTPRPSGYKIPRCTPALPDERLTLVGKIRIVPFRIIKEGLEVKETD